MADQTVSVSGPVQVESESRYRVALELMQIVDGFERKVVEEKGQKRDRKYWFTLYSQCLSCTHGRSIDNIMKLGQ